MPDMPFPPLGVPADMLSAVKKCPNLFMLWGYVIPSNQDVVCNVMGMGDFKPMQRMWC